jgi:hypothetical protein
MITKDLNSFHHWHICDRNVLEGGSDQQRSRRRGGHSSSYLFKGGSCLMDHRPQTAAADYRVRGLSVDKDKDLAKDKDIAKDKDRQQQHRPPTAAGMYVQCYTLTPSTADTV